MRKPTSCINEREHPARFRVWMKNGDPQSVSSTFTCFVSMIDWDRRWRKFENGDEPICVCEDAAREMGVVASLETVPASVVPTRKIPKKDGLAHGKPAKVPKI
jgi:hypothetical protein